jgi:hypothetical protein
VDGARDLFDKLVTQLPLFIPHQQVVEYRALRSGALGWQSFGGLGNVDILGHAAPRRFDRMRELV